MAAINNRRANCNAQPTHVRAGDGAVHSTVAGATNAFPANAVPAAFEVHVRAAIRARPHRTAQATVPQLTHARPVHTRAVRSRCGAAANRRARRSVRRDSLPRHRRAISCVPPRLAQTMPRSLQSSRANEMSRAWMCGRGEWIAGSTTIARSNTRH